jgi:hypothetical protein
MQNAQIIRALPKRTAKHAESSALRREAKAALAKAERLDEELRVLDQVTEVSEGIALLRRGERDRWVEALGDDIRRCAEIYPNAHNGGRTFGLYTYTDPFGRQGEQWHGAGLSQTEAQMAAMAWVVRGVRPSRS